MAAKGVRRRVGGRRRAALREAAPLSDSLLAVAVGVLAVVVFLPAVQNGFVLWDDDRMFLENQHYRGLGWSRLTWMWTTFHVGH
ncbi:MAG TPA: hypothetical protein VML54_06005, partial [Candidatus Limnocylindrales bacterium]|nr:hypothetical protein [Candidatus Limnocylindrales bacterium]